MDAVTASKGFVGAGALVPVGVGVALVDGVGDVALVAVGLGLGAAGGEENFTAVGVGGAASEEGIRAAGVGDAAAVLDGAGVADALVADGVGVAVGVAARAVPVTPLEITKRPWPGPA